MSVEDVHLSIKFCISFSTLSGVCLLFICSRNLTFNSVAYWYITWFHIDWIESITKTIPNLDIMPTLVCNEWCPSSVSIIEFLYFTFFAIVSSLRSSTQRFRDDVSQRVVHFSRPAGGTSCHYFIHLHPNEHNNHEVHCPRHRYPFL